MCPDDVHQDFICCLACLLLSANTICCHAVSLNVIKYLMLQMLF